MSGRNRSDSHEPAMAEICQRYRRLYVPAVSDVLDEMGLWHQCMDSGIRPLVPGGGHLAGPAYTALGAPNRSTEKQDPHLGLRLVDELSEHQVAVMATADDTVTGHWGELLTNGAKARGATGAVIDGGIRDSAAIAELEFPIYARFHAPRDAGGRWRVVDLQTRIVCGGVLVHPGDFVVGDSDGVVVVPKDSVVDVLVAAEEVVDRENEIRERVRQGESVEDLFREYRRF